MRIQKYLAEVEKSYHYRIKTIVPLDDDKMGRIEHAILKYNPLSLSQPKKTIIQKNPLDFPSIVASEVYIVDVELGPARVRLRHAAGTAHGPRYPGGLHRCRRSQ